MLVSRILMFVSLALFVAAGAVALTWMTGNFSALLAFGLAAHVAAHLVNGARVG
jgi:hypothetical protein